MAEPPPHSVHLLPYQTAWVRDDSPLKVYEKSRRIGITWAEAFDAVCGTHGAAIRPPTGTNHLYIAYNKEMSREFIEACAQHALTLNDWCRRNSKPVVMGQRSIDEIAIADEGRDILAYRIRFASGNEILALSSRPTNLRGRQGIITIDEAAHHMDLRALLTAGLATTMWGGAIRIISTHFGEDNEFNQLVEDIRAGRRNYSLHRTTLDDALAQGFYQTICSSLNRVWTPQGQDEWRAQLVSEFGDAADEELFCIPGKGGGVFLSAALIESRMRDGIPVLRGRGAEALDQFEPELMMAARTRLDATLMSCVGVDFGRSGDVSVFWPLQIASNTRRTTPFIVELRDCPYEVQRNILFRVLDMLPRFYSGALDATGAGGYLAEVTGQRYGFETAEHSGRIQAVMLSQEWYREHMPKLKAAFEDDRIEIPRHADVLADLRLLRMERGIAKVPDVHTRGTDAGQRHGDSAIACALALYAAQRGQVEYAYTAQRQSSNLFPYYEEDHRGSNGDTWRRQAWGRSKGSW